MRACGVLCWAIALSQEERFRPPFKFPLPQPFACLVGLVWWSHHFRPVIRHIVLGQLFPHNRGWQNGWLRLWGAKANTQRSQAALNEPQSARTHIHMHTHHTLPHFTTLYHTTHARTHAAHTSANTNTHKRTHIAYTQHVPWVRDGKRQAASSA
jgi:hypothetical protein